MGVDGTKKLRRRLSMLSSVLAGMSPPLPALSVLRRDVQAAQHWLDQTLKDIKELQTQPSGRPPDENRPESRSASERRIKNTTKFKNAYSKISRFGFSYDAGLLYLQELSKDFLKRSFETDQLLSHSHAWLDQDNYSNTTFDLDIARLEYTWSQVRDELSNLAREYSLEEVEADLTRDLSAQGGDDVQTQTASKVISPNRSVDSCLTSPGSIEPSSRVTLNSKTEHLEVQYWEVRLASRALSTATLFSVRRRRDSQSSSSLSLPTVIGVSCVGVGSAGGSYTSLLSPASDAAERLPTLRPGYKDNPSSDSLVSRDLNSNTVRVKQQVKATRSHRRPRHREPSNQLSLVKKKADNSQCICGNSSFSVLVIVYVGGNIFIICFIS
ncbi:hypothetical protein EB796_013017 [Bugula neritina]|uniref:Uncharacterized protein n=1 Tax=Bugula neritina TaxID=10212 RepID=A0A7J7JRM2_BUGNE|nr:hypothetical protein EB796_013017 [Bugula neritina]